MVVSQIHTNFYMEPKLHAPIHTQTRKNCTLHMNTIFGFLSGLE